MHIEVINTFLTVAETGRLSLAAERLNVTKAAVSARIKQLEAALGVELFERRHDGLRLSVAGRRFHQGARLVQGQWRRAQWEAKREGDARRSVSIGAHPALAGDVLVDWIAEIRAASPDVSVHALPDYSAQIIDQLAQGLLDVGVVYLPQAPPGLSVRRIFEDVLVMVSTHTGTLGEIGLDSYVFLDWGSGFVASHAETLTDLAFPHVQIGQGTLGLDYIRKHSGAGYVPERLVARDLAADSLRLVDGAPRFPRPVFAVYPSEAESPILQRATLAALTRVVSSIRDFHREGLNGCGPASLGSKF